MSLVQNPGSQQIIVFSHSLLALKNPEHSDRSPVLVNFNQKNIGNKALMSSSLSVF